jgi:hypothetical protein
MCIAHRGNGLAECGAEPLIDVIDCVGREAVRAGADRVRSALQYPEDRAKRNPMRRGDSMRELSG